MELDPHVADLIAAGEVVERPSSVVKELIENSIDAGAGIVTVEITAGGMTYIRVTDNGCGISLEDAGTAFLRHATSKLRGADGLEAISTLGFRGEALAAIAAVSRIELLTRQPGSSEGVSLALEAGAVYDISPAGCPEGTTIIVRDLFFNTPARQKFVKSDRAEAAAVASAALRSALSRPDVSICFIRDGKTEFHTPGDSQIDACVYSLLGREFSAGLLKVETVDEPISVSGFVSTPATVRGNRSYQFFFINGRPIKSILLQAALERAFANNIPSGRFPSCALYLTTKPCNVDVNVHPAKTEVKFVSDKQAFDAVYYAVLGAIERRGKPVDIGGHRDHQGQHQGQGQSQGQGQGRQHQRHNAFESMSSDAFKDKYAHVAANPNNSSVSEGYSASSRRREPSGAGYHIPDSSGFDIPNSDSKSEPGASFSLNSIPDFGLESGFGLESESDNANFRVIGEVLNTYIVVEYKNSVWFIDKHAAHERIHFNALQSKGYEPMSETLLTPVIWRSASEDVSLLLENADLLNKLGFLVESFGEDSVAARRIPSDIDISDVEQVLSDICEQLKYGGMAQPERRDNIFRSVACKAAIKAGRASDERELKALTARVISGEISQCPHGRPVAFEITKAALDKSFKRT